MRGFSPNRPSAGGGPRLELMVDKADSAQHEPREVVSRGYAARAQQCLQQWGISGLGDQQIWKLVDYHQHRRLCTFALKRAGLENASSQLEKATRHGRPSLPGSRRQSAQGSARPIAGGLSRTCRWPPQLEPATGRSFLAAAGRTRAQAWRLCDRPRRSVPSLPTRGSRSKTSDGLSILEL